MKLTKREMMLLFLLGTVAIVFIGVNYLIMPLYNSNRDARDTLSVLQDQMLTLNTEQQTTGAIDDQIALELEKTKELSAPFAQSIQTEQVSYWLNSLLKTNNLKMYSAEFTDVVSAAPSFDTDRSVPPADKLELPISNTADIVNGKQPAAAEPSPTATDAEAASSAAATEPTQASAQDTAVPPETYCTQVILNATGSYADIEKFMAALYAGGRAMTVDTLSISDFDMGGKMAVITMRFFSAPLTDNVQSESHSFPTPAGQGSLMQENAAPEPTPTESETP